MINKIVITAALSFSLIMSSFAELVPVGDDVLNEVSGQSGITLNAKIILGDESSFVFTNTSGKKKADATAGETGYLIVDELQGALEFEGLGFDLVSDLKNSGKSALQWTLPKKIKATNFKTTGIYISSTEEVNPGTTSTFLMGLKLNGELSLPANTQVSIFVVN
ncbi:conserved hypothetical protein [Oleispira antarctica RB-8]|uniref:Secreted protein n=1 Tax=Oleispira antarctica RB-8 TaxID=698738 RepID=R4YND3_OLEAN|nr:conserved hypothetical protein [Oleispira antarctica RB-8]